MPEQRRLFFAGVLACALAAPLQGTQPASIAVSSANIDALIQDMRRVEDPPMRLDAVRVLSGSAYKGPLAFKALSWAMQNDLNNDVRQAAAVALMDYDSGETLPLLEKFLREEIGDEVRRSVCAALASAPAYASNRGATTLLAERLGEDPSALVRLSLIDDLLRRQDPAALESLKRDAQKDDDKSVRAAAWAAHKKIAAPRKVREAKTAKPAPPSYNAVKGVDHCPLGFGWCECGRPPLKIKARCVQREDCEYSFFNSYKRQGFDCSWNGENIE